MGSNNEMTRKEFLVLTFTLVGATAAGASCDDDDNNLVTGTGGRGGTGGSTGTAGTGGTGTGGTGTAGTGTSTGTAGSGGGAAPPAATCADPLPETQLPDSTGHMHSVTVAASTLNSTTAQTFMTNVVLGHQHSITLQPAELSALKSGGSVTVTSSVADLHAHMFSVSCH